MSGRFSWTPVSFDGAPVSLHWTIPVVGVALCRADPVAWAAYAGLLLWHVLGHAIAVQTAGARCTRWEITGFGGRCRYRTTVGARARVAIAWSGVAAQGVLLLTALLVRALVDVPRTPADVTLVHFLVTVNLGLMAVELLPLRMFDGPEAWAFLGWGLEPPEPPPQYPRRRRTDAPEGRNLTPAQRAENERTFEKILAGMRASRAADRRDDDDASPPSNG